MSTLANRLKKALSDVGMSQSELARKIGIKPQSVQYLCSGKAQGTTHAVAIATVLNISPSWLLDEKEQTEPFHTSAMKSNAELIGGMEPWNSSTELPNDEVEIPFFTEVELAAGNGMIDAQEHKGFKLRFARSTLKKQGVDSANAACVKVSGNSMEPVLPDGSTIGVDIAKTNIVDGKMFALDHDGMLRVKTLYKVPGGGVRLKSFNSDEYPDEIYNKDESQLIRIIGKVFWYSVLI